MIVGINEFIEGDEPPIEIFRPPKDTAEKQKRRLMNLREARDNEKVKQVLGEIERLAGTEENLVPIVVEAAKAYATVGEISDVFRTVFGEYRETRL